MWITTPTQPLVSAMSLCDLFGLAFILSRTHDLQALHPSTIHNDQGKARTFINLLRLTVSPLDLEHEEERRGCSEEETKDKRSSNSSPERYFPVNSFESQRCQSLRSRPDLTELDLPSTMQTNFPDPADLLNFTLTITPDEGQQIVPI
jgi:hypothetical protein